jgi:hypothetical protein
MNGAIDMDMNARVRVGLIFSIGGLCIGLLGIGLEVWIWLSLLSVAPGTPIRPLGAAGTEVVIAAVSLAIGFPASILGLILAKGKRVYGILATVATLLPLPVGQFVFDYIVELRHLVLED